jgi:dTDP-4-dehydrorhamnose reductase
MRAIVVGGSGQIGGWLLHFLAERGHEALGTYHKVPQTGLVPLDASQLDLSAAWIRSQRPDVVFYPAGFTWVDGCERDPSLAESANFEQPMNLARVAAESGGRFVYFSTDYVFDGRHGPYDERAEANPLSAYGRSKLHAEQALADELGDLGLTVRTSWVFGPERQGKNFAYQLVKTLRQGRTLDCPSDQVSSPSYGPDVARAVVSLVEAKVAGMIHVVGPEVVGRVAFARAIAAAFRLDPSAIVPRSTAELGQGAPRPLDGGLLASRLDTILPGAIRPLAEALPDFIRRLEGGGGWAVPWS